MLQIITGKFFQSENILTTLHRGTYYTNYQAVEQDAFETIIGRILPSTLRSGLGTLTYELTEKLEGVRGVGVMTSTGGIEIVEDFAAVFSFVFDVICTTDPDLVRKLILPKSDEVSRNSYSSRFLPRVFDTRVFGKSADPEVLATFLSRLLGLPRATYAATIRAIRQYVAAMHDVGREPTLAYSLLVTSIEALSQSGDVPDAAWDDYDERKRKPIDALLQDASPEFAEKLKTAILESEHVSIARRFREFIKGYIGPEFYRSEADGRLGPVSQQNLDILLKDAYSIRSSYVHRLIELQGLAADPFAHTEVLYSPNSKPSLTFAGLARIVRHVIFRFVEQTAKVEREAHAWSTDLPNVLRLPISPMYWMSNPDGYNGSTASLWLETFLAQFCDMLLSPSSNQISDLSGILDKIETMDVDKLKGAERRAVLTLYCLFIQHYHTQRPQSADLAGKLEGELASPTIEGLTVYLFRQQDVPWSLEELDTLHSNYFRTRWNKGAPHLGKLLESIFTLSLAEMYRVQGMREKARQLTSFAVENVPGDPILLAIENAHIANPYSPITPYSVIPTTAVPEHSETSVSEKADAGVVTSGETAPGVDPPSTSE